MLGVSKRITPCLLQVIQEVERGEVRVKGFALLIAGAMFLSSCEGPAGPAGTDGTNGVDGNVTCLECHNGDNQAKIASEFAASQHSQGSSPHMGLSCTGCHMGEFDVEEGAGGHSFNPTVLACNSCHGDLEDFDYNGAQAFFNWTGLDEDRSLGVHNPNYVIALLKNSIKALV